jgi:hypothetical protein
MSDSELLATIRSEIREAFRLDREQTIKSTLERFGLDMSANDDYISQNKADKIIGRAARTRGKLSGIIGFKNISEGIYGRVMLRRSDVMKIKNLNKFQ